MLAMMVTSVGSGRHMGAATSAAQFSRSIGGTVGVSVMGAILAAGLPAAAAAIHPVFVIGVPMMAVTFALVAMIPELPLRRAVREDVTRGETPAHAGERDGALAA